MSIDRKDLKIQALLEKVARITTRYEDTEADHRVEITLLTEALREKDEELNQLKEPDATKKEDATTETQ